MRNCLCSMVFLLARIMGAKAPRRSRLGVGTAGCLLFVVLSIGACVKPDWHFGIGGKYNEANIELMRGRGADLEKAIANLEAIVKQDPSYRDSLTLLGKAYYRKGRYYDAFAFLQRALAVNKDDEIAWLFYGLTQIKVGENEKGLETVKGGLTLVGKAMRNNRYKEYQTWDPKGTVHSSLNRAVFQALKGLQERENLIQVTERLLTRIDEEEWFQRRGRDTDRNIEQD